MANKQLRVVAVALLAASIGACASGPQYRDYGDNRGYEAPRRCYDCGTIERIDVIQVTGESSGTGAVLGGIVGGVLGNQVGKGDGKKAATIAGAVGGAVAGNAIEKNTVKHDYRIVVRMEDGRRLTLTQPSLASGLREGSYVRIENGRVVPIRY